jgi:hypothetical protein
MNMAMSVIIRCIYGAFMGYPDRQIGEVKQSVEASVKYFRDRFETAIQKVDELYKLVEEAQNKGSYLMKLLHLRQYLIEFDGLGDYPALLADWIPWKQNSAQPLYITEAVTWK